MAHDPPQDPTVESAALAQSLTRLTRLSLDDQTLDDILGLLVAVARSAVGAADGASVSLIRTSPSGTRYETLNATSEEVQDADRAQYAAGTGPCLDAIRGERVNADLAASRDRWPEFVEAALAHGFRGVLSTPLVATDRPVGSLNLYARSAGVFGEAEESIAGVFADHAGVVLANAAAFATAGMVNAQLEEALASRDLIGKAQGILMAQRGCDEDEAFDLLRQASQRSNRKLREVAAEIVASVVRRANPGEEG